MVHVMNIVRNVGRNAGALRDAARIRNPRVLKNLLGPALRGFVFQRGKGVKSADIPAEYTAHFNLDYTDSNPVLRKLYSQAKRDQWDAERDVDWSIEVDIYDEEVPLMRQSMMPLDDIRAFRRLPRKIQLEHMGAISSWFLSQILHGEQGALFAACQVTESIHSIDGKLYGSTQVVDEGRHVEVFKRYLLTKLGRVFEINDNLYVIIDSLMSDSRWDMKFLGMQIMIEGLALAAFGTMRQNSAEPLLRDILKKVITDEARHVHFGVIALEEYYKSGLSPSELREREDWAFEVALLMRNRFLAHEFYDEYYAHTMSRRAWDQAVLHSEFMLMYRRAMFRRIIPNLKRIGLLSDRIKPYYNQLGLLEFEDHRAAPDLTAADMLEG